LPSWSALDQQSRTVWGQVLYLDPMTLAPQSLSHGRLGFPGVQIDLQPTLGGKGFKGKPSPHIVQRAGGATQIEALQGFSGHGQPNSPPNKPLLWGGRCPLLLW
jgi:hypothetical protein